jgi:hypothetical protein
MIKKILKSVLNLFLFSAIVHNVVLLYSTLRTGNIKYLNYFKIIGLDEFWPGIGNGMVSNLISVLIISTILIVFLILALRKKVSD